MKEELYFVTRPQPNSIRSPSGSWLLKSVIIFGTLQGMLLARLIHLGLHLGFLPFLLRDLVIIHYSVSSSDLGDLSNFSFVTPWVIVSSYLL